MARTSTWTTAPSTATSSGCARSSAAWTTASTTSRRCTASAIATRSTEGGSMDQPVRPPPHPKGRGFSFIPFFSRASVAKQTEGGASRASAREDRRAASGQVRYRFVSPLLRRILLVNALPLALLVATLLYLDQYQNGLLEAEVSALREQARIYAGALGESAVHDETPDNPKLVPELARPLLRRLTEPTPNAEAKLYAPDGQIVADSRVREGTSGAVTTEPLPPAASRGPWLAVVSWIYDRVLSILPHDTPKPLVVDVTPTAA